MTLLFTFALILVGLAGISAYAAGAAPGSFLYPVKVRVNEGVQSLLRLSPQADAQWEIQRAERRLLEAERLLQEGRLDKGAALELARNLEWHSARAQKEIGKLIADGEHLQAVALLGDLEVLLHTHSTILTRHKEKEGKIVWRETEFALLQVSYARKNSEINVVLHSDAQTLAEKEKERLEEFMKRFSADELGGAAMLLDEGTASLEAEAYAEAFETFQRARRLLRGQELLNGE